MSKIYIFTHVYGNRYEDKNVIAYNKKEDAYKRAAILLKQSCEEWLNYSSPKSGAIILKLLMKEDIEKAIEIFNQTSYFEKIMVALVELT